MKEINTKLCSLDVIKGINESLAVCEVTFECDDIRTIAIGSLADFQSMLGLSVLVSFREELFDGNVRRVVNTLTKIVTINTIEAEQDFKLFSNDVPPTESNVIFEDLKVGDVVTDAVFYVIAVSVGSSKLSNWVDCICLDRIRRVDKVRLFWPENGTTDFAGRYIRCDIQVTKFGAQTRQVSVVNGKPVQANPEIGIAKAYIQKCIEDDKELVDFCNRTDLLNLLENYYSGEKIEIGYDTVRAAMEISYCRNVANLVPELDVKLLVRAVLATRAHIANKSTKPYSDSLKNIMVITRFPLCDDARLMYILDESGDERLPEKAYLAKAKEMSRLLGSFRNNPEYLRSNSKMWEGA